MTEQMRQSVDATADSYMDAVRSEFLHDEQISSSDIAFAAANGMKKGIDWYLDNLWHPASVEPKEEVELVCEWEAMSETYHDIAFYEPTDKTFYSYERPLVDVTRWAYVEDIMKSVRQPVRKEGRK